MLLCCCVFICIIRTYINSLSLILVKSRQPHHLLTITGTMYVCFTSFHGYFGSSYSSDGSYLINTTYVNEKQSYLYGIIFTRTPLLRFSGNICSQNVTSVHTCTYIVHPESFRSNAQNAIAFARRNCPRVKRDDAFACVYLRSRAFAIVGVCEYCLRSTACAYVRIIIHS